MLVFDGRTSSAMCQAMASPSRSGSGASRTRVRDLGGRLDLVQHLLLAVDDLVLGLEVVLDVDPHLLLGQILHVADRRLHHVAGAQVLLDGLGLGGRLDDDQALPPRLRARGSLALALLVDRLFSIVGVGIRVGFGSPRRLHLPGGLCHRRLGSLGSGCLRGLRLDDRHFRLGLCCRGFGFRGRTSVAGGRGFFARRLNLGYRFLANWHATPLSTLLLRCKRTPGGSADRSVELRFGCERERFGQCPPEGERQFDRPGRPCGHSAQGRQQRRYRGWRHARWRRPPAVEHALELVHAVDSLGSARRQQSFGADAGTASSRRRIWDAKRAVTRAPDRGWASTTSTMSASEATSRLRAGNCRARGGVPGGYSVRMPPSPVRAISSNKPTWRSG